MKRHVWITATYLFFLFIGIPWYWEEGTTFLIMGLPAWFIVAIGVSVCASIFTAYILLCYPWNTDTGSDED
jgi:hypothetical protein